MPTLTKVDLVHRLARESKLLPNEAEQVIDLILEELKQAMLTSQRIEIRGFGAFSPHQRAARAGINPRNKARVEIPAKQVVIFKSSPALNEAINRDQKDSALHLPGSSYTRPEPAVK